MSIRGAVVFVGLCSIITVQTPSLFAFAMDEATSTYRQNTMKMRLQEAAPLPYISARQRAASYYSPPSDNAKAAIKSWFPLDGKYLTAGQLTEAGLASTEITAMPPMTLFRVVVDYKASSISLVGEGAVNISSFQPLNPPPSFTGLIKTLTDQLNGPFADPSLYQLRGVFAWGEGTYDQALADLDEAIRLDQNGASAYYFRGKVSLDLGISHNPSKDGDSRGRFESHEYLRAYSDLANALRLDRAERGLRQALDLPKRVDAYATLGQACLLLRYYSRAVENYTEALRLDPAMAEFYLSELLASRAEANALLLDPKAVEDYKRLLSIKRPGFEQLLKQIQGYEAVKQQPAIKAVGRFFARIVFGNVPAEAMPELLARAEADAFVKAMIDLAKVYEDFKRYDEAIATYDEVVDLSQKLGDLDRRRLANLSRANLYATLADLDPVPNYDKAISEYQIVANEPESSVANKKQAHIEITLLHKRGKASPATIIDDCEKVLKDDPNDANTRIYQAHHYMYLMQTGNAIINYSKVIQQEPDPLDARLGRGQAYLAQSSFPEAIADFNAVLKLDPKNKAASEGWSVAQSELAKQTQKAKDAATAAAAADDAKKHPPDNRLAIALLNAGLEETTARIEEARTRADVARATADKVRKSTQTPPNTPETDLTRAATQATLEATAANIEEARARAEKARLEAAQSLKLKQGIK